MLGTDNMYVHPFNFFHTIHSGYSGLSPCCNSFKCEHLEFRNLKQAATAFHCRWTGITRETVESNCVCMEGLCNTKCTFLCGWSWAEDRVTAFWRSAFSKVLGGMTAMIIFWNRLHRSNELHQSQRSWWTDILKQKNPNPNC